MKRGTAASLRWSNLFPKVYKLTHDFGRRGVDAFWELALEPLYPHPVRRARPARSSPVLRAQTQSPGLPGPGGAGKLHPGSAAYLAPTVGKRELAKHAFNIKPAELFVHVTPEAMVLFSPGTLGNGGWNCCSRAAAGPA